MKSNDGEIERYRCFLGYDYSRGASLFITIVTSPRRPWFGRIRDARVELTGLGKAVDESIRFTLSRIRGLRLQRHIVMPDHVHVRVYLAPGLEEPIGSFRLDGGEFWRGVGSVGILNEEREMIALRVSRKTSAERIAEAARRISARAGEFSVISGFISPGERAVFDALAANPNGRMVKVLPYAMPHDYMPSSGLLPLIKEGRLAIIAQGNSLDDLSRQACLDLNAAIIPIAEKLGRAIYLK